MTKTNLVRIVAILGALLLFILVSPYMHAQEQVKIAQLSDLHLGLASAPEGTENLRKAVQMINQRNPDVVVVTGDIGERPSAWGEAKDILKGLKAKVYYIPGNHDVHSDGPGKWKSEFGDDFYKFQVKFVTVYALDSQVLGNWDVFNARQEPPMSATAKSAGDEMLNWLGGQGGQTQQAEKKDKKKDKHDKKGQGQPAQGDGGTVAIAMQHVPAERDGAFPNDPKPYWTVNGDYKKREERLLKQLGVHDILAGHWHDGRVFDAGGFRWHVAPATSWSPFGAKLGFAIHTITPDGHVSTELVYLDGSSEKK